MSGLAVLAMVYALGHISAAHFNPLVPCGPGRKDHPTLRGQQSLPAPEPQPHEGQRQEAGLGPPGAVLGTCVPAPVGPDG